MSWFTNISSTLGSIMEVMAPMPDEQEKLEEIKKVQDDRKKSTAGVGARLVAQRAMGNDSPFQSPIKTQQLVNISNNNNAISNNNNNINNAMKTPTVSIQSNINNFSNNNNNMKVQINNNNSNNNKIRKTTELPNLHQFQKQEEEEEERDPITNKEIFDLIRSIDDPEHPLTLEQLQVVSVQQISVLGKFSILFLSILFSSF